MGRSSLDGVSYFHFDPSFLLLEVYVSAPRVIRTSKEKKLQIQGCVKTPETAQKLPHASPRRCPSSVKSRSSSTTPVSRTRIESTFQSDYSKKRRRLKFLNIWQVSIVSQEPVLFNDSIAYNIAYGRGDVPRSQVEQAAVSANAHDFVRDFPGGYETTVGERGVRLSGGQKQRIAIARALLMDPKIRKCRCPSLTFSFVSLAKPRSSLQSPASLSGPLNS